MATELSHVTSRATKLGLLLPPGAANYGMVRLNAGNDTNGNPRRVWVLLCDKAKDGISGAWDEGFDGANALPEDFRSFCAAAPTIPTTRSYCRMILRNYGRWNKWKP
jgi:hypothetical protein